MIELDGKPILEHNICMAKNAGISEIYINLHYLPDKISSYFEDGKDFGVNIQYSYEPKLLGTAGALLALSDDLGNEPFFLIYGDNYSKFNLLDLKQFHEEMNSDFSIVFHWRKNVINSGIAEFKDNGRILQFEEKPDKITHGDWVNAGIYFINPKRLIDIINPEDDFAQDVFPKLLASDNKLFGYKSSDIILDAIDTPRMLYSSLDK